jgi:CRISPR-associated protein Cas1
MFYQIVEIYEENRYLSLERGFLKISSGADIIARVPIDDIAVLLVSAQGVSFSKNILNELAERGGISVLCGKNYIPQSLIMPVSGNYQQSGVIKSQIDTSLPFRKNIWKQIVEIKLINQAKSLILRTKSVMAEKLIHISKTVKSGDSTNREAIGAKLYWKEFFGKDFIRDKDAGGINAMLNYGYAIVRASVARALCAAGLLPSFGVFHDNKLNPFCLADDFLEPWRPLVDVVVFQFSKENRVELNPETKKQLANVLWIKVKTTEGNSPLFQAMHYMCASFVHALRLKKAEIDIPVWEGEAYETLSDSEWV